MSLPDQSHQNIKVRHTINHQIQFLILTQIVYIYRIVLDSVGGVSSTRSTSLATLDLQNGEVRQLQFVNDDTLMILWRDSSKSLTHRLHIPPLNSVCNLTIYRTEGSSHLLNFPFQPDSAQPQSEASHPLPVVLGYIECDSTPSVPKPTTPPTTLDLSPEFHHTSVLIHIFALHGPKARPIHVDVNGRKGRRAICVLYGDAMRYEVLDLDAAMGEDEDEEDDEDYQEGGEEEDDDDEEVFDSDEENNEN